MSTPISAAAAGARETSRTTTGKFGPQHRPESPDVVLPPPFESLTEDDFDARFEPIDSPDGSTFWDKQAVCDRINSGALTDENVWSVFFDNDEDANTTYGPGYCTTADMCVVTKNPWTHHNMEVTEDGAGASTDGGQDDLHGLCSDCGEPNTDGHGGGGLCGRCADKACIDCGEPGAASRKDGRCVSCGDHTDEDSMNFGRQP